MSKENSLRNLYSVWGNRPLDHMFNNESVQFITDLAFESITSDEYMEYARKKNMHPTGTKFIKFNKNWEIISANKGLYYTCVCKDNKIYEFRDFIQSELEGVDFY